MYHDFKLHNVNSFCERGFSFYPEIKKKSFLEYKFFFNCDFSSNQWRNWNWMDSKEILEIFYFIMKSFSQRRQVKRLRFIFHCFVVSISCFSHFFLKMLYGNPSNFHCLSRCHKEAELHLIHIFKRNIVYLVRKQNTLTRGNRGEEC